MGKIILLPPSYGVDFSRNAMETIQQPPNPPSVEGTYHWYIDECPSDVSNARPANVANGGWAYYDTNNNKLRGKKINRVKFIPANAGTLLFYKSKSLHSQGEQIAEINITEEQLQKPTIYQFSAALIADDEYLIVGKVQTVGSFYFLASGEGFYSQIPRSPSPNANATLGLSVGYYGY